MKNVIATVFVAAGAFAIAAPASAQVTGSSPATSNMTICAEQGRNGWKITGDASSNFRDYRLNTIIGEIIGDGNCQAGWNMISSVDPRIDLGINRTTAVEYDVNTVLANSTDVVTTADAGRITASWQGFAPEQLKGLSVARGGDATKWKLVSSDGVNHTYKLKKQGIHPWPKGSRWVATDQAIIDRDFKGGTAIVPRLRWDKLRYAASRDTTVTTNDYDVTYTTTRTFTTSRVFCPSVWTYAFVAPTGEVVGTHQGRVSECSVKRGSVTVKSDSDTRTRQTSETVVGSKYVTPQN